MNEGITAMSQHASTHGHSPHSLSPSKERLAGTQRRGLNRAWARAWGLLALAAGLFASPAWAQETVCARVKIEIKQELTLERQAFDAEMKINNTTDTEVIENVAIEVKITDEAGTPVLATDNPNDLSAKFFVRLSNKQNIAAVDGTGTVNPKITSTINWLIIPAPGSAGISPLGKKYLVGATLKYKFGGEETVLNVAPDVITVKPLPLLTLDYFLTQDVWADDPLTAAIEPTEPFTLGVRVKNNGYATAKNLKIDSAQPKIIENNQGLLINFLLTGSYVNDTPAQNTLLINFGDIAPGTSKMGRWNMETTLAGKFTEFTARFSHADELGGALTSILQATNAHFLIRDVRVDLPGRDYVRDFLARDGDVIRVYESDGPDTEVTDRSGVATLTAGTGSNGNASYKLSFPATAGFAYVRLPDPFNGNKALGKIVRSDGKTLLPENVWLSKTRNEQSKQWEYWVNFFDVNTTGQYGSEFQAPPPVALPPVVQFIPDRVVKEGKQVSFLVEASSPDGRAVNLSAAPLPAGATFTLQAADPASPGVRRAIFDWTPAKGSAGNYLITYTAFDGSLSAARSANIKVEVDTPPPGPGTPTIEAPLSGAQVTSLKPTLSVQTSSNAQDPTTQVQFEVYADEAQTQLVASATVPKATAGGGSVALPTQWQVPADLADNTHYWWRARAFDGTLYSSWVNGRFFVNTFNDPPNSFQLLSPQPAALLYQGNPQLMWANATDKENDAVTYSVLVYSDASLNTVLTSVAGLIGVGVSNAWTIDKPLASGGTYYWRVIARDALGAETSTPARSFVVAGNQPPSLPTIVSPVDNTTVTSAAVTLTVANATDADGDAVTYQFELDVEPGFTTPNKRSSARLAAGGPGQTSWSVTDLQENTYYYWRVLASDGRSDAGWRSGKFFVNTKNDVPKLPGVVNPGVGAWVASGNPLFELNPAVDPEGDTVRYLFQVSSHPSEGGVLAHGEVTQTTWRTPVAFAAGSYWWRYRVADQSGFSEWSAWMAFSVKTAANQAPSIQLTAPAVPMVPQTIAGRRIVSIAWELGGVTSNAKVSLAYSTTANAASVNRIVEGLVQADGMRTGYYNWDVTDLSSGTYFVQGVVYNSEQSAVVIAPGAVVIPPAKQTGVLQVRSGTGSTDELGKTWLIQVRLNSAPSADVTIPISSSNLAEGATDSNRLIFTNLNWSVFQSVRVRGVNDCVRDGNQRYWVSIGKAQSLDPNFIGVSATSIPIANTDNGALSGCQ